MPKSLTALLILTLLPLFAKTQADPREQLNIVGSPTVYDSVVASWRTDNLNETFGDYLRDYIELDTTRYLPAVSTVTDNVCRTRLKNMVSPIYLPYNDIVKKHIVAYATTHKSVTRRMLSYGKYYFPMIEHELAKNGLPLELKFVAVIESALNPTATSPSGAVGLWQFMLQTGRQYGLEISSMVDARRDPVQATAAACRYMKDLYDIYHDWTLVMASYNYGPGNVNKALQRAGANASTYWDIYPFLPKATRDYVPAFVALAYLYYYHSDYGVVPFASPLPLATDTVMVSRRIDLNRVSEKLNLPSELVKLLNPQYKQDVIPATVKSYPLVLPQQEVCRFIECEQARLAQADTLPADTVSDGRLTASAASSQQGGSNGDGYSGPDPLTYKVKKGDTLGAIAHKYKVTVSQLMKWNQLKNSNLKIGQTLKIIR